MDCHLHMMGDCHLRMMGDCLLHTMGDCLLHTMGDYHLQMMVEYHEKECVMVLMELKGHVGEFHNFHPKALMVLVKGGNHLHVTGFHEREVIHLLKMVVCHVNLKGEFQHEGQELDSSFSAHQGQWRSLQ